MELCLRYWCQKQLNEPFSWGLVRITNNNCIRQENLRSQNVDSAQEINNSSTIMISCFSVCLPPYSYLPPSTTLIILFTSPSRVSSSPFFSYHPHLLVIRFLAVLLLHPLYSRRPSYLSYQEPAFLPVTCIPPTTILHPSSGLRRVDFRGA